MVRRLDEQPRRTRLSQPPSRVRAGQLAARLETIPDAEGPAPPREAVMHRCREKIPSGPTLWSPSEDVPLAQSLREKLVSRLSNQIGHERMPACRVMPAEAVQSLANIFSNN